MSDINAKKEIIKESVKRFLAVVKTEDDNDFELSTNALDSVYIAIGFKNGFLDAENILGEDEIATLDVDATDKEIDAAIGNVRKRLSKSIDIEKMSEFMFE